MTIHPSRSSRINRTLKGVRTQPGRTRFTLLYACVHRVKSEISLVTGIRNWNSYENFREKQKAPPDRALPVFLMLWLQLIHRVKSKHNALLAEFTHRPISPKKDPESDGDQLQNPASTSKRSKATIWEVLWCRLSGKLSSAEEINFWLNKFRETRSLGMNRLYSGTEYIGYQQMR